MRKEEKNMVVQRLATCDNCDDFDFGSAQISDISGRIIPIKKIDIAKNEIDIEVSQTGNKVLFVSILNREGFLQKVKVHLEN